LSQDFECRDEAQAGTCRLRVRAQPGARREGLRGTWNGRLRLSVSAPPEDGRANARLVQLLSRLLGLRRQQVELVAGERARDKEFRVELSCREARTRLGPQLDAHPEDA
jgi:uncharacterized protein